jgi:hypothetical protein
LVRLDPEEHPVLRKFVFVRVTNMSGVDLDLFDFDCDLTFCALIMTPHGEILHTYGGRDEFDAESHLSVSSMLRVLEQAAAEFDDEVACAPLWVKGQTVDQMPPMARRIRAGKKPDCIHCHTVNDVRTEWAREKRAWRQEQVFRWPDPVQVGLRLDKEDQALITEVIDGSPAAKLRLKKGDRLVKMGYQSILTYGDVCRVLHDTSLDGGTIAVEWARGDETQKGKLRLKRGWRIATPEVFAWRASKWPLSPKPGFGGPQLTKVELKGLGLAEDSFAFRVKYIVTWGKSAHTGRNAQQAGIRKGDVVIRIGGKNDFRSMGHFHAWFRLTRKTGEKVPIEILRNGNKRVIQLKAVGER